MPISFFTPPRLLAATTLFCTLALAACGGGDKTTEEKKADDDGTSVSAGGAVAAMQAIAKQAEESQKNGPVETIDFRKLKDLLPTEAGGLTRKSATGEKNGAAGMTFSTATATYENADNSQHVDLTIVDAGGSGMMMGMAAWSMIDMDKETETGYERTTKYGDYKAYEKYDKADKSGETAVLVKNRFLVTAKGNGIEPDVLKTSIDALDLEKVAALK